MGRGHAQNISRHPQSRLSAVTDSNTTAAEALARSHGCAVRSPEEIFAAADIDAVVIATPAQTHSALIEAAALAGKAIFCEKPFEIDLPRARHCAEIVRKRGVPMFLAFHRRFDDSFASLQRRLREGEVGAPELVFLTSRDPSAPPLDYIERSGGLFRDMMVHDFDMARWLVGQEPETVYAVGGCLENPAIGKLGFVDTALVTLGFRSGLAVSINCAMRATYGYDQRIEVHASQGMLSLGNRFETSVTRANAGGYGRELPLAFFVERYERAYEKELDYFLACLREGAAPSPGCEEGLRALILGEAAHQSYHSGRPVKLTEVDV